MQTGLQLLESLGFAMPIIIMCMYLTYTVHVHVHA